MTVIEKWYQMISSFADIENAVIEAGGMLTEKNGYNQYADAIRGIYSDAHTEIYEYPVRIQDTKKYAVSLISWCKIIKEQIRLAIADSGIECDTTTALSEYGNKIRQISVNFEVKTTMLPAAEYGVPYTARLEAIGGKKPYTWEYVGFGPAGLSVSKDGVVSFTPVSTGLYGAATFICKDSDGKSIETEIMINIMPRKVHIELIGNSTFTYDGKPHTLDLRCVEVPELALKVVYGASRLEAPVEVGTYYATIQSTSSRYSIIRDRDYRLTIVSAE